MNGISDGIMFGNKHTYLDWGLIMTEKPEISSPAPKTVYIDIPASDGKLDVTESLTGDVKYDMRQLKFKFKTVGDEPYLSDIYSEMQDYIHGQIVKIVSDLDNSYYYIGRCEIEWKTNRKIATATITVEAEPYKYELNSSLEDWLWDPFDFETGIIREYKDLVVYKTMTLVIPGRRKKVIPTIYASIENGKTLFVSHNDTKYQLNNGRNTIINLILDCNDEELIFEGYGNVSVDYRGARL